MFDIDLIENIPPENTLYHRKAVLRTVIVFSINMVLSRAFICPSHCSDFLHRHVLFL